MSSFLMEFHLPFFAILLLFLFMIIKTVNRPKSTKKLPPSPWKLPIIGNLLQLAISGSLPHRALTRLAKKHGPIMYLQLGEVPTIVISSPETAEEVLKTHDVNFSDRPNYLLAFKILTYDSADIVFSPYGNYWRKLRQICMTELLSPKRVHSFQYIRENEVSNFIEAISSCQGSAINLSEMISSLTCNITSAAAFGNTWKADQQRFISNLAKAVELASGFCLSDMYPSIKVLEVISGLKPKLEKLHQENDKILENIITKHKEKTMTSRYGDGEVYHKDLLDVLLELQVHGEVESPLTNTNIKAAIWDIFAAGTDAVSTTVEWAMSEMLKNPRIMKKAQTEVREAFHENGNVDETVIHKMKFLKAVIKETLRLHPAAPLSLPRECRESCEISGYEIPAKARVIVNSWAIGRDPRYWTEAERFYPERFIDSSIDYKGRHFQFIPFGAGRRICPGISFAQSNIELPLAKLLYHFDWELPNGKRLEDLDMAEAFGLNVRRKEHLLLIPIRYHHSSVK